MRQVSDAFKAAAYAQETGERLIVLLTITHPDLTDGPIRLTQDTGTRTSDDPLRYQTESRGETYDFLPFQVRLPDDQESGAPKALLILDNIAREMVAIIRSISTPPVIDIEVVLSGSPDTVEVKFPRFKIVNVTYDAQTIQGDLSIEGLATEPFGFMIFDPSRFPALFNDAVA